MPKNSTSIYKTAIVICVSVKEKNFKRCMERVKNAPMAEIRADLCRFSIPQIEALVEQNRNVIITCRIANSSIEYAEKYITAALEKGAEYADLEIEAPVRLMEKIRSAAAENGAKLIISHHDFNGTPPLSELEKIAAECIKKGADIVKIVTAARSVEEGARVLRLYRSRLFRDSPEKQLAAFAMGEKAGFTRYLSLRLGAPFAYVSCDRADSETEDGKTAPGQYTFSQMSALLEKGGFELPQKIETDTVSVPSSKSAAQRGIIAALLSEGESVLENYQSCGDNEDALRIAEESGCTVTREFPDKIRIYSPGIAKLKQNLKSKKIMTGESGLLTRLMLPIIACLSKDCIEIAGSGSLMGRDFSESEKALKAAGAECESDNGRLPFKIKSRASRDVVSFSGENSSQIVSGFLMAMPLERKIKRLEISNPASRPYIELTLKILRLFGIDFDVVEESSGKMIFTLKEKAEYRPAHIVLDGDWSSAAYFAVAFTLDGLKRLGRRNDFANPKKRKTGNPKIYKIENMPPNSSQADEAILKVLETCGVRIEYEAVSEESANRNILISVTERLKPFYYDATHSPDLFPVLAVLACFCKGESRIRGVHRLKNKESDRAEAVFTELTSLGADIGFESDEMIITGEEIENHPLHGGDCHSHDDHRIAMSLAVAATGIEEKIRINDIKCIGKSFPSFFEKLKKS